MHDRQISPWLGVQHAECHIWLPVLEAQSDLNCKDAILCSVSSKLCPALICDTYYGTVWYEYHDMPPVRQVRTKDAKRCTRIRLAMLG